MTDPTFDDLIPPRPAGALHYGEPTFDDLIPWQPAGVPHYGEPTFDDLIPNQGAPWQPSSSGDGAVHFGPPVGEAVAGQAVQQSQPIARPVQTPAAPVTPIVPDDIVARPPQTRDFTTDLPKVTRHGPSDGSTASVPTPQASSSQISKPSGANLHHAGDLSQQQMPKPDPGELTARWAVAHVGAGVQDGYAKVAPSWTGDVTMNASWGVGHTPGAVVRRFVPNSAVRNPSWGVQ